MVEVLSIVTAVAMAVGAGALLVLLTASITAIAILGPLLKRVIGLLERADYASCSVVSIEPARIRG